MSMTTQYFFSPTYFSPYYFWPLAPIGQKTPNTIGTYGDAEVFASILSILQSSRRFANVRFGLGSGQSASSPNVYPQVVVTPGKAPRQNNLTIFRCCGLWRSCRM